MFCPNCGANVPDNQAFCSTCGASMTPAAAPKQQAPRQQVAAAKNLLSKDALAKDSLLIFRIAIIALAVLSIILIFSKGIAAPINDDGDANMIMEWDYFFKDICDESASLPIVFQVLSVVFVVGAAATVVVSYFMPQLSKISIYNLIPVIVAAVNLLLYIILLIVAMVTFGDVSEDIGAHPASASWFYIADMIALIVVSVKMNKAKK